MRIYQHNQKKMERLVYPKGKIFIQSKKMHRIYQHNEKMRIYQHNKKMEDLYIQKVFNQKKCISKR